MKVFAAMALAAALSACAAPGPEAPPLSVVSVRDMPGKSKTDICRSARDWAALTFKDSKAVVEVYDLEAGRMIGKGRVVLSGHVGVQFPVDFTLQIDCKDGRVRTTYDGFTSSYQGQSYPLREDPLNNLQTKARERVGDLNTGLFGAIMGTAARDAW